MLGVLFSGPPSFLQKGGDGEGFAMVVDFTSVRAWDVALRQRCPYRH